jgi:hypothetical protein
MKKHNPFRYFKTSPEVIRLAVMLYVRFPLSLRNVEDLLHERGIEVSHEQSGFGGTGSVRYSPLKSGGSGLIACGQGPIGGGISTRFS